MIRALALLALAAGCSKDRGAAPGAAPGSAASGSAVPADGPERATQVKALLAPAVAKVCECKDRPCAKARLDALFALAEREAPPSARSADRRLDAIVGEQIMNANACADAALSTAEMPAVPPVVTANADAMITYAYQQLATPRSVVTDIEVKYVQSDGTLPPTYGVMRIGTGRRTPSVPTDDPDRPIGAPVPESPAPEEPDGDLKCPVYTWSGSTPQVGTKGCSTTRVITRPRCSVTAIWERAIAEGAPAAALAQITVMPASDGLDQFWSFKISDPARSINIAKYFQDDCAVTVERE